MSAAEQAETMLADLDRFLERGRPADLPAVPPFPLDVLPDALRRYVAESAAACGAPVDFVAVPVLGLAEGTMGRSRRLIVKGGFEVAPGGWYGIAGEPGTAKTPAMKMALRLIEPLEARADERFRHAMDEWQDTSKEERGPRPRREHFFVTDSTMEALGDALEGSLGVTQYEDELLRRLKALDAYRKAGDRQVMLSLWSNATIKIARKTTGAIYIPAPSAPLVGATQPGVLERLRGEGIDAAVDDGWVPRFCLVLPDADVPEWSEAELSAATLAAAQAVFQGLRLYRDTPHVVTLSAEGYVEWKRWYGENREMQRASTGLARQWAAKAPFHLARLTLTLHALTTVERDAADVSAATLRDGIELVEYFRGHLARILPAFGGRAAPTGAGVPARALRALNRRSENDGWMSTTELHRALGNSVTAERLRNALDALMAEDRIEQRQIATATKPVSEWRVKRADLGETAGRRNEEFEESPRLTPLGSETSNTSFLHAPIPPPNAYRPHRPDLTAVPDDLRPTVAELVTYSASERARYRREIAEAPADDPYVGHDRTALDWAERLLNLTGGVGEQRGGATDGA